MARMILMAGEDNAPLFLVDLVSKVSTRFSQGIQFTEDSTWFRHDGDYIWATDRNSTIACYTKDLVDISRVDYGRYASTVQGEWNTFHINGEFVYVLTNRMHDGATATYDVADEQQLTIRKFNKVALTEVSEVVLSNALLWDNVGKIPLVSTTNYFWTGEFLWIKSAATNDWYKINVNTGVVVDTWANGPAYEVRWTNADTSITIGSMSAQSTSIALANFDTKTLSTTSTDILAAGFAASMWPVDYWALPSSELINHNFTVSLIDEATKTIRFGLKYDATYGSNEDFTIVTLNWETGVVSFTSTISATNVTLPDAGKTPLGATPPLLYITNTLIISPTELFAWTKSCMFFFDFTANTVVAFATASMQPYSNDGTYIRTARLIEIPEVVISGKVTQSGSPIADRKVYLYDQATGQKMAETTTNNSGDYSFIKYTTRSYFVVCSGPNQNANYKINSYL